MAVFASGPFALPHEIYFATDCMIIERINDYITYLGLWSDFRPPSSIVTSTLTGTAVQLTINQKRHIQGSYAYEPSLLVVDGPLPIKLFDPATCLH